MKKEYIERTNAKLRFNYNDDYKGNVVKNILDYIPAANVAPVVHGEWKITHGEIGDPFNNQVFDTIDLFTCSICGECFDVSEARNYCPNCGAKMDGGNNEDNMQ